MTPEEVAMLLRVPLSTLYGWRYKGVGPSGTRVGRHLRYRRDAVMEWLRQQEESDPPAAQPGRSYAGQ
jgi:excisionase family DNA binding protein